MIQTFLLLQSQRVKSHRQTQISEFYCLTNQKTKAIFNFPSELSQICSRFLNTHLSFHFCLTWGIYFSLKDAFFILPFCNQRGFTVAKEKWSEWTQLPPCNGKIWVIFDYWSITAAPKPLNFNHVNYSLFLRLVYDGLNQVVSN